MADHGLEYVSLIRVDYLRAPCLVMALLSASMQFDVSSELCRLQPTMLYGAKLLFLNKAPVLKSGSIIKMVIDMVNNAMKKIPNHEGLILHSDQ